MNSTTLKNLGKRILFLFAFVSLFSFSSMAQKIASVDVNQILQKMEEYQSAQEELDKLASKWRQDIAQEYDVIKGLYSRYQAEQVLMSDDMRKDKEDEIMVKEKEVREMQRKKFGPEGELYKKRQSLVQPIQDRVYDAIEDYAKDRSLDFIFDKSGSAGIIFANSKYDRTDDILKKLGL